MGQQVLNDDPKYCAWVQQSATKQDPSSASALLEFAAFLSTNATQDLAANASAKSKTNGYPQGQRNPSAKRDSTQSPPSSAKGVNAEAGGADSVLLSPAPAPRASVKLYGQDSKSAPPSRAQNGAASGKKFSPGRTSPSEAPGQSIASGKWRLEF